MGAATERSLIAIDELGKSTSTSGVPTYLPPSCCFGMRDGMARNASCPCQSDRHHLHSSNHLGVDGSHLQDARPVKQLRKPQAPCKEVFSCCTDGIAIAWAVSEELIGLGAYTLFATHFTALSQLAELYPNAQLWHFTVDSSVQVGSPGSPLNPSNPALP